MHLDGYTPGDPEPTTPADQWIFSRLARLVAQIDTLYEEFEFGEVTRELYAFFWNEFCDWYIEFSKSRLDEANDPADRLACQRNLMFVLDQAIRLLHPIMPFVTEEIYQELPFDRTDEPYLIGAQWPDAAALAAYRNEDAERAIEMVCQTVTAIRSTRARYHISPKVALEIAVKATGADGALLDAQRGLIESMGNSAALTIADELEKPAASAVVLCSGFEVFVTLAGLVDFEAERARLQKELVKLMADGAKLAKKLSNGGYLAKAAAEIIEKDRTKHAEIADKIQRINEQLKSLI